MSTLTPSSSLTPFEFGTTIPGSSALSHSPLTESFHAVLSEQELAPAAHSRAKRLMDFIGAFCGLIMLGPLMLTVVILVRLDSSGPALFRQLRLGRGGRPFWCLKFRSMTTDAERRQGEVEALNEVGSGVLFKIRRDPRVTRLGRFLRITSLDELPQLINVLRGDMSLVGPRPLQLRDCEKLEEHDRMRYRHRMRVTPGLTGPWQVSGRSSLDIQDMLDLDLEYVDRWSPTLDMTIIVRTISVVLSGRGAS